jgi:hypothetical protein
LILALTIFLCAPAQAESQCGPADELKKILREKYKEQPRIGMIAQNSTPMVIWENPKTGTWTLVISTPTTACIVAAGSGGIKILPMVKGTAL